MSLGRFQEWLGRAVREPLTGLPILLLVLYLTYLVRRRVRRADAGRAAREGLFGAYINPWATAAAVAHSRRRCVRDFLVGEYGLITMGMTYAIAIVLPVVTTFFLVFGFLEDSGYIPRLAIFSDRLFRAMGLNGKAVLPMVLGLGCDTMATMTTRILATPKERLIAILLLALGVPCSAQLATIMGILGGISFAALVDALRRRAVPDGAGRLPRRAVLTGERSDFIMELPPMRLPRFRNLMTKTVLRVRWYLGEAVPLFLVGTVLLFVLDRVGRPGRDCRRRAAARHRRCSGLPPKAAEVFVMGFLRRDYGAAGLFLMARDGSLSHVQAVVALTVMTLFVPCVANFLMIVKERGLADRSRHPGVRHPDCGRHWRGAQCRIEECSMSASELHPLSSLPPRRPRAHRPRHARSHRPRRAAGRDGRQRRRHGDRAADVPRHRLRVRPDRARRRADASRIPFWWSLSRGETVMKTS